MKIKMTHSIALASWPTNNILIFLTESMFVRIMKKSCNFGRKYSWSGFSLKGGEFEKKMLQRTFETYEEEKKNEENCVIRSFIIRKLP
jgi:hypothetical protein